MTWVAYFNVWSRRWHARLFYNPNNADRYAEWLAADRPLTPVKRGKL